MSLHILSKKAHLTDSHVQKKSVFKRDPLPQMRLLHAILNLTCAVQLMTKGGGTGPGGSLVSMTKFVILSAGL